jgi:hypothetical protein
MTPEYLVQIPPVKDWIHRCDAKGEAHGAALAESIGRTGVGSCAEEAELCLARLDQFRDVSVYRLE